jgi:endo-1,4-beta-xylanase
MDNTLDKLEKLMLLGEEIVIGNSEERLKKKIVSCETQNFLVGGQAFGIEKGEKYKKIHKETFNLGIAPLYFFLLKPDSAKKTSWELTDKIVSWLRKTNRPIKGHPLVWLHKYARPEWMLEFNYQELLKFLEKHIVQVVNRYKNDIKMWDIVNEIPAEDANGFDLTNEQLIEITDMTSKLVKKLQPDAERIVNFSEIFGAHSYIHEKPSVPPTYMLKLLENNGVEYESIGLQFYMGMKKEFACRELMDISQTIDAFSEFDKDIHFSELGWPSKHDVDPYCFFSSDHPEVAGRWHRGWDEELQAEFLDKIYALFASKPNSKSITWWDLTDNGHHEDIGSRFIPFAGLTRRDFSEKPALKSLKKFKEAIK